MITDLKSSGYAIPVEWIVCMIVTPENTMDVGRMVIVLVVVQHMLIIRGFQSTELTKQTVDI